MGYRPPMPTPPYVSPPWLATMASSMAELAEVRDPRALGRRVGLSRQELDRAVLEHFHTVPTNLLDVWRVEATRRLVMGGASLDGLASAVGYRDLRTVRRRFSARNFLTLDEAGALTGARRFALRLPAWLAPEPVLAYLGRDSRGLSEVRDGDRVRWGGYVDDEAYVVTVTIRTGHAEVEIDGPAAARPETGWTVHRLVLRLLGLHLDPRPFERRLARDAELAPLRTAAGRNRTVPQTRDLFDALLWVVAGQQVSLPVAFALRRRLTRHAGRPIAEGLWAPPTPRAVAELDDDTMRGLGFSRAKSRYLREIAGSVVEGSLRLTAPVDSAPAWTDRLLSVRGLGIWSVRYLLMRAFGFADCVPLGDAALARKIQSFRGLDTRPSVAEIDRWMARFAPYRSLATFALWAWPDPPRSRSPGRSG